MKTNIYLEAQNLAKEIREQLRLGSAPVKNIFSLLEGQGLFVVKMPINGDGLSGAFYYNKDRDRGEILINSNRSPGHQNFSAAHEYCHFLFDKAQGIIIDDKKTVKSAIEKRADCFAANFLMPEVGVKNFVWERLKLRKALIDNETLVRIKNEFGVSWAALIFRLHSLGFSFDKSYKEKLKETRSLNSLSIQMGFEPERPTLEGDFYLPADFRLLAFKAYFNKKISLSRLSELLRQSYEKTKDQVAQVKKVIHEKNQQ